MNANQTEPVFAPSLWSCRLLAALLIVGAAALRILFLANDCPFDLSTDEAHYWHWSLNLDWSYYSKGPLVAYLIRLGCWLAGGWSVQLTGSEMLAVRLPAIVCGSLLLVSLYILTVQIYRNERPALAVVAFALTLPLIAAGSTLMTIDSPYTCLWGWGLVLGHSAIFGRAAWAWPALGLVIGLGILAKYTMILWPAALGVFLLTSSRYRPLLLRPGLWICLLMAGLFCLPILFWNLRNDWAGLWHVSHLAGGQRTRTQLFWQGPLIYLGVQFALLLGFWFVAWARAMWSARPWRETDPQQQYLWWLSFVPFGLFLVFSFTTNGGEPNWPVTAYLSGMVLSIGWLAREWQTARGWYRPVLRFSVAAGCALGIILTAMVYQSPRLTPLFAGLLSAPTSSNPMPVRRLDPTCRLRGWQILAGAVDQELTRLRQQGIEPVVAGGNWTLPGELAFYCKSRPQVYSVGLPLGARHSQYDFWRPNPVADPGPFLGRTFIFVGDPGLLRQTGAFDEVGPTHVIYHREAGVPVAMWQLTLCRGFRGFRFDPQQNKRF